MRGLLVDSSAPNAVSNAIGYAKFFSPSHNAVIRVYDEAGNVIETHEHTANALIYHEACFGAMTTTAGKQDN